MQLTDKLSALSKSTRVLLIPLIAVVVGWLISREAWLPLVAVVTVSLLIAWPAHLWLAVFAFLVPFDDVSAVGPGASGLTLTSLVGLVTIFTVLGTSLALGRFSLPSRPAMYWCAFLAWEACTVMWSVNSDVAVSRLSTAFSLLLLYLVVTCCEFSEKELSHIVRFAILGGCAASAAALYLLRTGVFFRNMNMRGSLVFGDRAIDPNIFAASLLLPFALALGGFLGSKRLYPKILHASGALLIASGILVTTSRGALLSMAVMTLFFVRKVGVSWRILAAPALLGAALMFAPGFLFTRLQQAESTGGAGRIYIWQTGLAALKDYFFIGAGLDNFSVIYNEYAARAFHFVGLNRAPHNVFLQVAVEAGVVGFALFMVAVVSHFKAAWRREPFTEGVARFRLIACEAAAYGMLVASFFLHLLWTKEFWMVWIMLTICSRGPRGVMAQMPATKLQPGAHIPQPRGVLVKL